MSSHEMAHFLDFGGGDAFKLDDFRNGERGESAVTDAVEVMRDGALCGAGDTKLFRYPGVFVELESLAIEVIIVFGVVDGKLVRTDADNGSWNVRFSPKDTY